MSGANNTKPVPAAGGMGWPGANVLSIQVPLFFVLTGVLSLLGAISLIAIRPEVITTYHYNQYIIAITHLVVLGWIASVVMGAMYQLVPVALETKLYSQRLAGLQYILHLAGFTGMVWMFWRWDMKQVGHFGSLLGVGVLLFIYNLVRTLFRVPRWNVVATAIASTLFWLALTVSVGLMIAAGKSSHEAVEGSAPGGWLASLVSLVRDLGRFAARFDQILLMHAHAHAGVMGVFVMLIVGVSYRLVPMFTLSDIQDHRRAMMSVVLLNVGLFGAFLTIALRSPLKALFGLIVAAGLGLYALELRSILRSRKRRNIDWAVKYFLTGVVAFAFLSPVGLVLSWPALPLTNFTGQLEGVYGFVALLGLVSFAIIGMLYKIVPFLVWYHSYSRKIGLARVPSLADLYSVRLQSAGYFLHILGLATGVGAILLQSSRLTQLACACLAGAVVLLLVNVAKMIQHIFWPQITPLTGPQPGGKKPLPSTMTASVAGSTLA